MTDLVLACVCLLLALAVIMLRKAYFAWPEFELKRRAAAGDEYARIIYPAVAYGTEFRALLWLILAALTAVAIVLLNRIAPLGIGVVLIIVWLWLGFSWMPNSRVSDFNLRLAKLSAPFFIWIMGWSFPAVKQLNRVSGRYQGGHTGVYEADDLRRFLQTQARQTDNRIPPHQLARLNKIIEFEDAKVETHLKEWQDTLRLTAEDKIGPKLLDEMHRSNQSAFCVVKNKNSRQVVGILPRNNVGLSSEGKVKDYMLSEIDYIGEEDSIEQALNDFAHNSAPLLVVTDNANDAVGILTLKEALSGLLDERPAQEPKPSDTKEEEPGAEKLEEVEEA